MIRLSKVMVSTWGAASLGLTGFVLSKLADTGNAVHIPLVLIVGGGFVLGGVRLLERIFFAGVARQEREVEFGFELVRIVQRRAPTAMFFLYKTVEVTSVNENMGVSLSLPAARLHCRRSSVSYFEAVVQ